MKRASFNISNIELEYPFVLAPLAGITDKSMRSLCWEAGASLTYTEMVSGKGLWYGDRKTGQLLQIGENEGPVAYQLFGSEPEIMAHSVSVLSEAAEDPDRPGEDSPKAGANAMRDPKPSKAGAPGVRDPKSSKAGAPWPGYSNDRRPVLFDLNAGCPVPKIVKNGEGSALLKDPDRLYDVVSAMVKAAERAAQPRPVTVKIRKGFGREEDCAVEIARAAQAAGAAAVTVHGRTREQYYDGRADWKVIAAVKKALKIPVIGNGDVKCGQDGMDMMDQTGCDGVMIARGAMGNPWIFREAAALWRGDPVPAPPGAEERIRMLLRHLELICQDKGEDTAVREIRKHVGWYVKGLPGATRLRRQVNEIGDAERMKEAIRGMLPGPGRTGRAGSAPVMKPRITGLPFP